MKKENIKRRKESNKFKREVRREKSTEKKKEK